MTRHITARFTSNVNRTAPLRAKTPFCLLGDESGAPARSFEANIDFFVSACGHRVNLVAMRMRPP